MTLTPVEFPISLFCYSHRSQILVYALLSSFSLLLFPFLLLLSLHNLQHKAKPSNPSPGSSLVSRRGTFNSFHSRAPCSRGQNAQRVSMQERRTIELHISIVFKMFSSYTHVAILDCLRGPWRVFGRRRPLHLPGYSPGDM